MGQSNQHADIINSFQLCCLGTHTWRCEAQWQSECLEKILYELPLSDVGKNIYDKDTDKKLH